MSEAVTSTFTFYGNEKIRDLEKEIIRRFKDDYDKGHAKDDDKYTAVTRILYGMSKEDQFNSWELLGAYGCWYFGSTNKFELESKNVPPEKLQDHIAEYCSKLDPNVAIQMDYRGYTPQIIGTRIVSFDKKKGILAQKEEETNMDYWYCDEDDIDDVLEDQPELCIFDIMSFQQIEEQIEQHQLDAIKKFNAKTGKNISLDISR
jgi:hypothetical protein